MKDRRKSTPNPKSMNTLVQKVPRGREGGPPEFMHIAEYDEADPMFSRSIEVSPVMSSSATVLSMRISYRPPTRHIFSAVLLCLSASLVCLSGARAQVLAQKNWAGSGVTVELWWRRAVYYRIDPTKFQDSTGNGKGDLAGITQRLDYLQSLGVDALILQTAPSGTKAALLPTAENSTAFDALVRDATERHLRVLIELGAPASQQADAQYVQTARAWLNQGAAGLYVPTQALQKVDGAGHIALLLQQLRALTDNFPGERVLLADAPAEQDAVLANALAKYTQLTASAPIGLPDRNHAMPTVAGLRAEWTADLGDTSATALPAPAIAAPAIAAPATKPVKGRHEAARSQAANDPLLLAARVPAMTDAKAKLALERTLAVMLLASRSAVLLDYGQELGLELAGNNEPLMQWTPTNLTREPPPKPAPPTPTPPAGNGYGTYTPYIRPLPRNFFRPPAMPLVEESDQPTPVDPASLPGFTAGNFDAAMEAPNGANANAATEANEPSSLLNLYRQLIQLHHANATLRSGSQTVLNRDAGNALVWIRHAPASSRTSTTVVIACNLSDKPLTLSNLGALSVDSMRSLLSPAPTDLLQVAPGAVLVVETR